VRVCHFPDGGREHTRDAWGLNGIKASLQIKPFKSVEEIRGHTKEPTDTVFIVNSLLPAIPLS
jgi:hypothetical protein